MVHTAAIKSAAHRHTVGSGKCALFAAGCTLARCTRPVIVTDSFRPQRYVLLASSTSAYCRSAPHGTVLSAVRTFAVDAHGASGKTERETENLHSPWRLMGLRA
eukprot:COSAG02_NODE_921_length_15917_cov_4.428057_15_plen_104_part_00